LESIYYIIYKYKILGILFIQRKMQKRGKWYSGNCMITKLSGSLRRGFTFQRNEKLFDSKNDLNGVYFSQIVQGFILNGF